MDGVWAVKCRPRGLVACDKRVINVGATFMSPVASGEMPVHVARMAAMKCRPCVM